MKIKRVEHIAIAVRDLEAGNRIFRDLFGIPMEYEEEHPKYATKLSMFPVGETYLELLAAIGENSNVHKWIAEKGEGLYHICFEVEDIEGALAELTAKGVPLLDERPRPGHANSRIAFLDPRGTGNVLIELAELPKAPGIV